VEKEFNYIREIFFPRWDKKGRWKIKLGPLPPESPPKSQGWCDRKKRKITIKYIPENQNIFYALLIHECCHAVTNDDHEKWFQERMLKVAQKAYQIGNEMLGNLIKFEVDRGYQ